MTEDTTTAKGRAERDRIMAPVLLRPLRCIKVADRLFRLDAAEDNSVAALTPIKEGAHLTRDPSADLFAPFEDAALFWRPLSPSSRILLTSMPAAWCDAGAETHFVTADAHSFSACRLAILERAIGGIIDASFYDIALYVRGRRGLGVLGRRDYRIPRTPALW